MNYGNDTDDISLVSHLEGGVRYCSSQNRILLEGLGVRVNVMVFNATFSNISVISQRSVLLVEETRVPGKNTDLTQVTDKLYHIKLYRIHFPELDSNSQGDRH
jgi:hypothetical protein